MTAFSHTHSAPNAAEEPEYFDFVCRMAQSAVKDALNSLSPALASWGIGENTVGLNRRTDSTDFDNRLGILSVTAPENESPRVLLLRVTAHALSLIHIYRGFQLFPHPIVPHLPASFHT